MRVIVMTKWMKQNRHADIELFVADESAKDAALGLALSIEQPSSCAQDAELDKDLALRKVTIL